MVDKAPERSLHRKLAQIMYEAERIPKNGVGPREQGSYAFVQVGDAADFIRKALAEKVVTMMPTKVQLVGQSDRPTAKGGTMTTVDLIVTWALTDGESGETMTVESFGAGADTGDKYSGKASTSAMKYALLTGFLLSTGDDTENHDTSDRQARPQGDPQGRTHAPGYEPNEPPLSRDDPRMIAQEMARLEGRPAPPRLPPREDPATNEPPPPPAESQAPYAETEELLGRLRRAGTIRRGTSEHYKVEARTGPEGHVIGFRLEVGPDKHIPQCVVDGPLGELLYAATGGKVGDLIGTHATVAGLLYSVKDNRHSRSWYRLHVDRIETTINGLDVILPADPEPLLPAEPPADAHLFGEVA